MSNAEDRKKWLQEAKNWIEQQEKSIEENNIHISYFKKLMVNFKVRIKLMTEETKEITQKTRKYIKDNKLKIKF